MDWERIYENWHFALPPLPAHTYILSSLAESKQTIHLLFLEVEFDDSSGAFHCKNLLCVFWPEKQEKFSAEGCSGHSIGGVCSIFITMSPGMDAEEVDAIAVAESVHVLIFLLAFFAKAVGDVHSPYHHYRNMTMVQEPLQHSLVPKFSPDFFFLLFRLFIIFSFSLFFPVHFL